ncbi:MAG: flagellar basal body rod protein FlgB [Clostridiaceae bacterium]|nr:flagellar basal body rod protein FlgB [Eubacteriales bacterium]
MIKDIFASTKYLEKGLDAAWLRNQVISNNIANAETPGFKSSSVEFEDVFAAALDDTNGFDNKMTRDKHISFSGVDPDGVVPTVVKNSGTDMRMDGNNVDIDYENVELAKNTLYYNTLVEKLNSEFSMLRMAITEGR